MPHKKPEPLPETQKLDLAVVKQAVRSTRAPGALVVLCGPEADLGLHVVLNRPVTIGRDPSAELCLHAEGVSRRHCHIHEEAGSWFIEDLRSTNGTLVNGAPVQRRLLVAGDRIHLGHCVLKFTGADERAGACHARMDALAGSDDLTGLPSKRRFDAAFARALSDAAATARPLALLALDLDGLKQINDRHGHAFGAFAIAQVGALLGEVVGQAGVACRFGGDEFLAFVRGKDRPDGCLVAEQVRRELASRTLEKDGVVLHPTLSIGVSSFPADGQTTESLFVRADEALYRAKRGGRDQVAT